MYVLPKCDEINAINIKYQDDRWHSNREKNNSLSLIMAKISNINLMQIYHVFIKTTTKNDILCTNYDLACSKKFNYLALHLKQNCI